MANPHVSVRKHICWDPDDGGIPAEPTSTVVLTSANGYYVDIRLLKEKETDEHDIKLSTESLTQIDWAFAGTSTELESRPGRGYTVMQWLHWVDSRHLKDGNSELSKDVGHLFPPDAKGDTLEKGRMENPLTGVESGYEELWGSVAIQSANDGPKRVCIVLQTSETDIPQPGRGMVIRIGQFIQGLLVRDGELILERWQHDGREWHLKCRVGSLNLSLPCKRLSQEAHFTIGNTFDWQGVKWKVLEEQ